MTVTSISLLDRATWRDAYIGLVALAAAGLGVYSVANATDEPTDVVGVAFLFVAMLIAERLSVPVPRGAYVSVSTIPHIVAALLLPIWLAVGISGAAMLSDQLLARAGARKVLFNTSSVVLTVGMTASVADGVGLTRDALGTAGQWQQGAAFLLVAATYYATTNMLTAAVVSLDGGTHIGRILVDNARFTLPAEFAVCVLGGLVAVLWVVSPGWAPLLLFPGIIAQAALTYVSASKRSNARLALLAEASHRLALSLDESDVPERLAELTVPVLAERCAVYLVSSGGEGDVFRKVAAAHSTEARFSDPTRDTSEPPVWARRALQENRAVLDGPSRMAAPLQSGSRRLGLLTLESARSGRKYDAADLSLAEDLAKRCAVSLENARLHAEAQRASRLRDEFLSVAAHELKTPVTSLRGYTQLLRRRLVANQTPEPQLLDRALSTIEAQSTKLGQLTAQLLDVSRIQAGKLLLEPNSFDLVKLVREVAAAHSAASERHSMHLILPTECPIVADPLRLEQVVSNLLSNAIKYSPAGGPVLVSLERSDATVQLVVRDHGVGIPAQRREQLFDRFYQAHGEGYFGGLGLGLYISREIVELHGGSISADFPADGGTRFTMTLPAGPADRIQPTVPTDVVASRA